jgi:hypothetical protein
MQPGQCVGAVEPARSLVAVGRQALRQGGFAAFLGVDVGHGQALTARQVGVAGEVLPQRQLDVAGAGVLALDAVGVVRVHAAQQRAQLQQRALAGDGAQRVGCARQVAGPLQQRGGGGR